MFVCKAKNQNIMVIKRILRCFEQASGLKTNLFKSSIGGIGVDSLTLNMYSIILNYRTMIVSFTYLGKSICKNHRRKVFWKGMIEKIRKILFRWKGRQISLADRVSLIKLVLSTMPFIFLINFLKCHTM